VLARHQGLDVVRKPRSRGARHTGNLTDFIAKCLFRLLIHPSLRDPETGRRGQKQGYGNRSQNLSVEFHFFWHPSSSNQPRIAESHVLPRRAFSAPQPHVVPPSSRWLRPVSP